MIVKSLPLTRTFRLLWWPAVAVVLLLIQAALSVTVREGGILSTYGMITYFLVIVLAAGIATLNAVQSREAIRIFWSFLATALAVWSVSAWSWIHAELGFGGKRPAYLVVAAPLFLHIVLMIAAVVSRPHLKLSPQRGYRTTLNFLLLLFFWVFAYALLLVEYPYTSWDAALILRGQALYFAENFLLLVVLGVLIFRAQPPWKSIYWHLLGASALYVLGSLLVNIVFSFRGLYGSLRYIPFTTAAACWFVWVALRGRRLAPQLARSLQPDTGDTKYASLLALMSVIAVPVIGVWELFRADEPYRIRVMRLLIVLLSVFFLAVFAFVKEYLANRELSSDIGLSNDRLRLAMEASASVGWDSEVKSGRVLWFGDLQSIFGIPSNTYAGSVEEFIRYIHPDDRPQVSEAFADARQNRKPYAAEFRIVRADGTVRWLVARGKFYYATNGDPERMLGVSLDITDRKQAEDAVRETEKRYRRIVETTNEGVWLLDSKLHTSYVNRQMAEMLGYEAREMVGRSVLDSYFPEDIEHKKQLLKRRQQGARAQVEERLRQRDGSELWVRMAATPVFNDNGEFDGALAMVSDITERKRAEEALRESEERFRLVADTAPALIWMSGEDRLCIFFNQGWLHFTGRSMEQELGEGWTFGVHPDDLEQCLGIYSAAFDARVDFEMEYRLRRVDGEYRWIVDYGVPRFRADGTFCGYIGSCVDITDRKLLETSLHELSGRLIHAQEEERARIARELHDDLSQRMALLSIGLEQFEQGMPDLSSKARQQLHHIAEVTRELSSDIHNLSHQLHPSKLDTLGLVAAVWGLCKELSKQHDLQIKFVHDDVPGQIPKDVTLCLFRIVQEALRNVVKHSGAMEAKLELSSHGDEIDLCISDRGQGFDPELVKGEAGLGLISMRERLRLVGGHLSVESEPSHGTRIRVRIPLSSTTGQGTSEQKQHKASA